MESWLKSFCYKVSCTLKICSMLSSSSSESPTPGSLQGSLDSAFDSYLLCIVAAQDFGWNPKLFLDINQNVSKGEIVLIFTG